MKERIKTNYTFEERPEIKKISSYNQFWIGLRNTGKAVIPKWNI